MPDGLWGWRGWLVALLALSVLAIYIYGRTDPDDRWEYHYRRAWAAIRSDHLEEAAGHLLEAARIAKDFPAGDRRLADTFDDLAQVEYSRGDDFRAEGFEGRALVELIRAVGPRHPDVERFLGRLRLILIRRGRKDMAESLRGRPWRVYRLAYVPRDLRLAGELEELSARYAGWEELEAARELLAECLEIRTRLLGTRHEVTERTRVRLGELAKGATPGGERTPPAASEQSPPVNPPSAPAHAGRAGSGGSVSDGAAAEPPSAGD